MRLPFSRKKGENPPCSAIEIFARHATYSAASAHKRRPEFFSHELCWRNLCATFNRGSARITALLDTAHGGTHFLDRETDIPVVRFQGGTEAKAFLFLLDYIESLCLSPETVVYIVEDDYLHRPGWLKILKEGLEIPEVDYVTLYDHNDKYFFPMYRNLKSKLYVTDSCHWRTIPSTTQTFATRWQRLQNDLWAHRLYSTGRKVSADHEKFSRLTRRGAILVSSIPGWSTHAEPEFASPCVDWSQLIR